MSVLIFKEHDPLDAFATTVDGLLSDASYARVQLNRLIRDDKASPEDPRVKEYAKLAGAYFALATQAQGLLQNLADFEEKDVPPTIFQNIPPYIRKEMIALATENKFTVNLTALESVSFVPLQNNIRVF